MVDEISSNGLFNHSEDYHKRGPPGSVSILCIDKGYHLLNRLTSTLKSASPKSLTMERICKLCDSDYWYSVKASKGKRVGVPSAHMSLATYTTPWRFLTEM